MYVYLVKKCVCLCNSICLYVVKRSVVLGEEELVSYVYLYLFFKKGLFCMYVCMYVYSLKICVYTCTCIHPCALSHTHAVRLLDGSAGAFLCCPQQQALLVNKKH